MQHLDSSSFSRSSSVSQRSPHPTYEHVLVVVEHVERNPDQMAVAVAVHRQGEEKGCCSRNPTRSSSTMLFSFLTMPLGRIVRLFDKQSQVGCLDRLYKSVESLGEGHFRAKACKSMLLAPSIPAASHCPPASSES
ncbi:hypothetical protein ZWY2020_012328 [Hordeum vulgare]|nr:hypothetical protein ZWY2020_012328 [Hordeum vulgare]